MDINYYKKYEPIFGEYYIKKELGEGSYGKVFLIERNDLGTVYQAALKAITIPKNKNELSTLLLQHKDPSTYCRSVVDHYRKEVELMSALKGNSNIVSYENHKFIQHEDGVGWDILMQMEYLTPLFEYLGKNGNLSPKEVAGLGVDLCNALELCHNNGIIHRDVKPENIMISKNGYFKLGDFGVSKVTETTATGTMAGTMNYMAPEVFNREKYGPSADLYSLGLVMYSLVNNYLLPFEQENDISINAREIANSKRMCGMQIPAPSGGDESLNAIILKACSPEPENRFRSATEFKAALEAYMKGETAPLRASMPSREAPVKKQPEPVRQTDSGQQDKAVRQTAAPKKQPQKQPQKAAKPSGSSSQKSKLFKIGVPSGIAAAAIVLFMVFSGGGAGGDGETAKVTSYGGIDWKEQSIGAVSLQVPADANLMNYRIDSVTDQYTSYENDGTDENPAGVMLSYYDDETSKPDDVTAEEWYEDRSDSFLDEKTSFETDYCSGYKDDDQIMFQKDGDLYEIFLTGLYAQDNSEDIVDYVIDSIQDAPKLEMPDAPEAINMTDYSMTIPDDMKQTYCWYDYDWAVGDRQSDPIYAGLNVAFDSGTEIEFDEGSSDIFYEYVKGQENSTKLDLNGVEAYSFSVADKPNEYGISTVFHINESYYKVELDEDVNGTISDSEIDTYNEMLQTLERK